MNQYSPIVSEFASDEEEAVYDVWFRKKVAEAQADTRPPVPHDEAMARIDAVIAKAIAQRKEC